MIPKIIHQTWHSPVYDSDKGSPESWRRHNPDWEYRFWTDADLEAFVRDEFPEFLDLYLGYPNNVQRADLARYMLLFRFGGVYADMDTDCLASFDALAGENRVILCEEPSLHWDQARLFGMDRLYFNGTMASPAGHPFWKHVIDCAWDVRHVAAKDVVESTGPVMLTGAIGRWSRKEELSLNSCHLFAPLGREGVDCGDPIQGDYAQLSLSRHNWAGSWYVRDTPPEPLRSRLKGMWRKMRVRALAPRPLTFETAMGRIDSDTLYSPAAPLDPDKLPNVAIFIPVRDGAPFIENNFKLIQALDYPRERLRLVYCEGDSTDDSRAILERLRDEHGRFYRGFDVLSYSTGLTLRRRKRWKPKYQWKRRSAIARARNALIRGGLTTDDEWVLWIDVDVCAFEPGVLKTLLLDGAKIVTPNCMIEPGGRSYDLNAFYEIGKPRDSLYYKHMVKGLFHPPDTYQHRRFLHDMRYLDRAPLVSVGGTMLLVHGAVHRSGLVFPEIPYRDLVETEGFGRLAYDAGVKPVGLPNVEIFHVNS